MLWSGSGEHPAVPAPRTAPTAVQPVIAAATAVDQPAVQSPAPAHSPAPAPVTGGTAPPAGGTAPPAPVTGGIASPGAARGGLARPAVVGGIVVVAGLCVLALVLLITPLVGDHDGGAGSPTQTSSSVPGSTRPSSAAATPSASASSADPSPSPSAGGFTLPAGWSMRDDGTGFHVPVPDGWTAGHDSEGRALWRSPDRARLLLIDQSRQPKPDPVADWENNEKARRDGYQDYHRVRLKEVSYWDKAADWEFIYTLNGTPTHVLNRGFITAPDQAYSIYFSTPDAQWADAGPQLATILAGFQPARS